MLIAEIGNNHFGNFNKAKEMVRISKECGADMAKLQAIRANELHHCSMPNDFYLRCEFSLSQYIDLIDYGRLIGIPVFYSIFSRDLVLILAHQARHKFSAYQMENEVVNFNSIDSHLSIVSFSSSKNLPKLKKASVLFASAYLDMAADLFEIDRMREHFKRRVGYSDHTIGIKNCLIANDEFECNIIEKHFTLEKDMKFEGQVFRDTVHASTPHEFEKLANSMKG